MIDVIKTTQNQFSICDTVEKFFQILNELHVALNCDPFAVISKAIENTTAVFTVGMLQQESMRYFSWVLHCEKGYDTIAFTIDTMMDCEYVVALSNTEELDYIPCMHDYPTVPYYPTKEDLIQLLPNFVENDAHKRIFAPYKWYWIGDIQILRDYRKPSYNTACALFQVSKPAEKENVAFKKRTLTPLKIDDLDINKLNQPIRLDIGIKDVKTADTIYTNVHRSNIPLSHLTSKPLEEYLDMEVPHMVMYPPASRLNGIYYYYKNRGGYVISCFTKTVFTSVLSKYEEIMLNGIKKENILFSHVNFV